MASGTLYNLMWVYREIGDAERQRYRPVSYVRGTFNVDVVEPPLPQVRAVILYPSLLTPEIVVQGNQLELLLLAREGEIEIKKEHVNNQLKVHKGLAKGFDDAPLIDEECRQRNSGLPIEVRKVGTISEDPEVIETKLLSALSSGMPDAQGRFSGLIDRRVLKYFHEERYKDLYRVAITDVAGLMTIVDNKTYRNAGKITKRYYYLNVGDGAGSWLEEILHNHGIKNGSDVFHRTRAATREVVNYLKTNAPNERNRIFFKDPVIFRGRGTRDEIITKRCRDNTGNVRSTPATLRRDKKEKHLKLFDETYRSGWRRHDPNVRQGSGAYWNGDHTRYIDSADRLIIYVNERVFIPHEKGSRELHDDLVHKKIRQLNGNAWNSTDNGGMFGFNINDSDGVDMTTTCGDVPIESWHPFFYYPSNNKVFNIGHITDLHLVSRQQALAKSNARVIEYPRINRDDPNNPVIVPNSEDDLDVSKRVGDLVNKYAKNVKDLFDSFGSAQDVDMVLVTGDLIDHMKNVYCEDISEDVQAKDIWGMMNLEGAYTQRYKPFVDNISFYSLVLYFYRNYRKPIFVVSGNHDCYENPYGISPRVGGSLRERGFKRANEGIPADHNLTIYEAILAFGKSYALITDLSNFNVDQFAWFYTVFTPFSDFAVDLPKQTLTGIAWGEDEEVISTPGYIGDQGMGHLPRAEETLSDNQKKIIDKAIGFAGEAKKTIMMSHFTIASFGESIPMDNDRRLAKDRNGSAKIEYSTGWDPSLYDFGTLEKRREYLYKDKLYTTNPATTNGKIHAVLTGHSHRRGLYGIEGIDEGIFTDDGLTMRFGEFGSAIPRPAIIVSDSGGPLPRYNKEGEFHGWGSWYATGTKVQFGINGSVVNVQKVQVGPKPRFAVAMDYTSIFATVTRRVRVPVVTRTGVVYREEPREFPVPAFSRFETPSLSDYTFTIEINRDITTDRNDPVNDIEILKMILYAKDGNNWEKIDMGTGTRVRNIYQFSMSNDSRRNFQRARNNIGRIKTFIAIKFDSRSQKYLHYDFQSYWTFMCALKVDDGKYKIIREPRPAEIPDFTNDRKSSTYNYLQKYP